MGGLNSTVIDPEEFIIYENNNNTVHLKSRFARFDYCLTDTPSSNQNNWDSYWYLEQWASFHPQYLRTLVLRSKITYVGTGFFDMNSKQLPVLFSRF